MKPGGMLAPAAQGHVSRRGFVAAGFSGLVAHPAVTPVAADNLKKSELIRTVELKAHVYHVQGLDLDERAFYVTSVDKEARRGLLQKFDLSGTLLCEADVTDGPRFHAGGISRIGRALWVPVAEYRPDSSTRIERRSAGDLSLTSSFLVDDHIGAVAGNQQAVYGVNWGAKTIYQWSSLGQIRSKRASTTNIQYQDMKLVGDELIASGEAPGLESGAVDRLSRRLRLKRRIVTGRTPLGPLWTHEGMALRNHELYFLPEDGDAKTGTTHVYVFKIPPGLGF